MRRFIFVLVAMVCLRATVPLAAQEIDAGRVRAAVERGLKPVQNGLKDFSANKRMPPVEIMPALPQAYRKAGCISCHHEGLGLSTLSVLRQKGFKVDEELISLETTTLRRAYDEFAPLYRRALTDPKAAREADFFEDIAVQMGYMLGGLLDSGQPRDATIDAATRLLLKFQQDDGSWTYTIAREPMQSSDFTTTALAARIVSAYVPEESAAKPLANARRWLLENKPETTDDLAFRLWGLRWLGASAPERDEASKALRDVQREDGGWGQSPDSSASDAYATGLALMALHQGGGVPSTDASYRRGVQYLLETQKPDGTWYVRKWAHAYNQYFDAGFPYGKSQYISLPATCYAIMALAQAAEPSSKVAAEAGSARQ